MGARAPLRLKGSSLPLDRVVVMGVLNVTPDSFSDGGLWLEPDRALNHALEMVAAGAGIVDVGGESTRPGADPVGEAEETSRVMPVIEALAGRLPVPISIDTRKASVAQRALDAGASLINDTLGEERDGAMDRLVAASGAGIVLMHSRGTPGTMRSLARYDDVVGELVRWFRSRLDELEAAGVDERSIALDPGIGFAKDARHNLEILRRLEEIVDLGFPVLVGTSRKSFIGAVLDVKEAQRLPGTAATVSWSVEHGARIVRVHDVPEMIQVVRMTEAMMSPEEVIL